MKLHNQTLLTAALISTGMLLMTGCADVVQKHYKPAWESLKNYEVPDWYADAKFGIFIHWGPYTVAAFDSEWYPHNMYDKGGDSYEYHKKNWGDHKEFGYKDFIPLFKAEKFDADEWADLFEKAGAKYVVPVACHHEGFAMYDSSHTKWNSVKMGPKRDILGELTKSCRDRGMKVGASSHYAMNWDYYPHLEEFDTVDPAMAALYNEPHPTGQPPSKKFIKHWYTRTLEIVDKYQPDILWFDFGFFRPAFEPYRRKIAAYYYNKGLEWDKGVALNYKDNIYPFGTAVLDLERGRLDDVYPMLWQTDTSISFESWSYIEKDRFKPVDSLINDLVDIVSKNGVLLLNIGPRADGTIPTPARERLLTIGQWLKINGEAIYDTRPWHTYGEGPQRTEGTDYGVGEEAEYGPEDIRFTTKADFLYAISLGRPRQELKIRALGENAQPNLKVLDISMLGCDKKLHWKRTPGQLVIKMPDEKVGEYACCFKIKLKGVAIGGLRVHPQDSTIKAEAKVINYGDEAFSKTLFLYLDDKPVITQEITAAPQTVEQIYFNHPVQRANFYSVAIGHSDFATGSKKVALPVIDLTGKWLFKRGDSSDWKKPDLDDSDWRRVTLPAETYPYTQEIDFHWFRKKIFVPKEFEGCGLLLTLGKIDGADITFFNGRRVGSMSRIPFGDERPMWEDTRRYRVPPEAIKYGRQNVIAVRIYGLKDCGMYAEVEPVKYIENWLEEDEDEDEDE
jgi:alpha-L-fucosidase